MMLTMIALLQTAFACGPYGGFAASEQGAWAFEDGDAITMYTTDGTQIEIPIFGELIDMDFVGDDLVVAYVEKDENFVLLFDQTGEELADWNPRHPQAHIRDITVKRDGLVIVTENNGRFGFARLTDNLVQLHNIGPRQKFGQ